MAENAQWSDYFLDPSVMGDFFGLFVPYVGWGLALGACLFGLGAVLWFVIDALRF